MSDLTGSGPDAPGLERRAVLRGGLGAGLAAGGFGALGLTGTAWAQGPGKQGSGLVAMDLPGGLALISGAGANVVAARGPKGAVMVDGGLAQHAPAVADLVLKKTRSKSVALLFNTCWRLEQTGANDLLGGQGAAIIAHENTKLWMGTRIASRWENRVYPKRAKAALPSETFYTRYETALGDERIECGYLLQAHTDGDIYVRFPKANVIVVGGLACANAWPVIDWETGGWIGGMVRGLETLINLADDSTLIITAEGPPLKRADLKAQHEMYVAIMAKLKTMMESGFGADRMLQGAPAKDYETARGDPSQFLTQALKSFWGHVRQFDVV